ncbi:MAG: UDP-N-acetylglucosamine 2-epimerase (non-hydrolyzing) [Candidatus Latescibacter sp.]|nr:UDP-N-acetylglucosamine 2-epimerase (non-hydrolyzing) [Candidatus Latescibacter sp.]
MKKILTILGARPQFIKAAAVSRALAKSSLLHEEIIHTGQHFDRNMSEIFFREMGIPEPAANLGISGGSHSDMTARMLQAIEQELVAREPDCVLIYGDTNSTLAGALAGAKLMLPVAHVEAGLRSFNRAMPEELNRMVADRLSVLLFCPSSAAADNLHREGIGDEKRNDTPGAPSFADSPEVLVTGDVMADMIRIFGGEAQNRHGVLDALDIGDCPFILATVHRPENTDNPDNLRSIARAFEILSGRKTPVILPLHPRTLQAAARLGIEFPNGVHVIEPLSYLDMLGLTGKAQCVITDSGGLQKEAFLLGRPCVTMRAQTEWTETVDSGWNIVAGADSDRIIRAYEEMCRRITEYREIPRDVYGDGHAAERIVEALENRLYR